MKDPKTVHAVERERFFQYMEECSQQEDCLCESFQSSIRNAFMTRCPKRKKNEWSAMDLAAIGALFIGEEFVQRLENCDDDQERGVVAEDFWIPFQFHLLKFHGNLLQKHFIDPSTPVSREFVNYTELLHLPSGYPTVDSILTTEDTGNSRKQLIEELKDIFSNANRAYGHCGKTRDMSEIANRHPMYLASQFKSRFQALQSSPAKPIHAKEFRTMEILRNDNKKDRLGLMDLFEFNSNLKAGFCVSNDKISVKRSEYFEHMHKICILVSLMVMLVLKYLMIFSKCRIPVYI